MVRRPLEALSDSQIQTGNCEFIKTGIQYSGIFGIQRDIQSIPTYKNRFKMPDGTGRRTDDRGIQTWLKAQK